jgi:hypothetical protein
MTSRNIFLIILMGFYLFFKTSPILSQVNSNDLTVSVFMDVFPNRISGITFNNSGFMYVAESGSHPLKRIFKIDTSRKIDTVLSLKCFAFQYLKAGPDNSIYASVVIDSGQDNASVMKISAESKISLVATGFTQPVAMTFDIHNNLYVVDAMQRKVFKITPENKKTIFLDIGQFPGFKDILYHGLDLDIENKRMILAGINFNGAGNLLMFNINPKGELIEEPAILDTSNCKQVISAHNKLFATVNSNSLLIKDLGNGQTNIIDHQLLTNGMTLSFGSKDFGADKLYINAFDRILKVTFK